MPVKRYGIFVTYSPFASLRAEGLGRYLAAFLRAACKRSDVRFVVACPTWSRQQIVELCESEGIDPSRFDVMTPTRESIVLRLGSAFLRRRVTARGSSLAARALDLARALGSAYAGWLERQVARSRTGLVFLPLTAQFIILLAVAVPAKETVVLLVPAYLAVALGPGRGGHALMTTAIAAGACVAAFLAVRLPLGWRPGNEAMNGLPGLMIGTNLGLGEPVAASEVPLYENYLQPALFVGVFLPPIALGWRRIDGQLRRVVLVVTPLLLLSNLGFGWMYESRNYMPLVPLLATAALPHGRGGDSRKGA